MTSACIHELTNVKIDTIFIVQMHQMCKIKRTSLGFMLLCCSLVSSSPIASCLQNNLHNTDLFGRN